MNSKNNAFSSFKDGSGKVEQFKNSFGFAVEFTEHILGIEELITPTWSHATMLRANTDINFILINYLENVQLLSLPFAPWRLKGYENVVLENLAN